MQIMRQADFTARAVLHLARAENREYLSTGSAAISRKKELRN